MTVNTTAPIEALQISPVQPQAPPNTPTGPAAATSPAAGLATAAAVAASSATSSTASSTPTFPAAPANTPVSPSRPALPSPLGKASPSKSSYTADSDDNGDPDDLLPQDAAELLPNASLVKYANFKSFVSLVVTPFFQGMFYGFGEGTAKVLIGRWFGIDPLTALGGAQPAHQSQADRRRRRKPFDFFGLFSRKQHDAPAVADAAVAPEMGGPVGWISSKLRSNALEGVSSADGGRDAGLKMFHMGMDDEVPIAGFSGKNDRRSAFT
ncbi:hypothetical protein HDU86_002791 [Geranomyces michiganensis]|nr:hypothetical protein HDU86_002791 [Geranomyces michiganensis]